MRRSIPLHAMALPVALAAFSPLALSTETLHAEAAATEASSFKAAIDLFNGKDFCVSKSASSLLPPKPSPLMSGRSIESANYTLKTAFPCGAAPFMAEPWSPRDVLIRLNDLFIKPIDLQTIDTTAFKKKYNLALFFSLATERKICFSKSEQHKAKLAEMWAEIDRNDYMGAMDTNVVVTLFGKVTTCP